MANYLYVGVDAGSVSLNCVVLDEEKNLVYEAPYKRHLGKVEEEALTLLEEILERFGADAIRSISFTGNHGKKLSEKVGAFYEFETI
ncbi:MAG TPA: hypothetical protein ENG73_05150, partial [Desulfobacterales bacterium]|nr:hypothetical protein [Desulfobacterales bacterium]